MDETGDHSAVRVAAEAVCGRGVGDIDAEGGVFRGDRVARLRMAVRAVGRSEIELLVPQCGIRLPRRVALFAGLEVVSARDRESRGLRLRPGVGRNALQAAHRVAEQTVRGLATRRRTAAAPQWRRRPGADQTAMSGVLVSRVVAG